MFIILFKFTFILNLGFFCFKYFFIIHSKNHPILVPGNRLFDQNTQLRAENLRLNINKEFGFENCAGGGGDTNAKIQQLEKKLLAQQEELTELHKRKGENAQMIVEMNIKLSDLQKTLHDKEKQLAEAKNQNQSLRAEVQMLTISIEELKLINSTVRDEYTTLHLHNTKLEEKTRAMQDENLQLVEQLLKYKTVEADKANAENETFLKWVIRI